MSWFGRLPAIFRRRGSPDREGIPQETRPDLVPLAPEELASDMERVYGCLRELADEEGYGVLSLRVLEARCGLSRTQVVTALRVLEERGLVARVAKQRDKRGVSADVYRVKEPFPSAEPSPGEQS